MSSSDTTQLTDRNFDAEVLKSAEPILVDFWAPWCAPCRAIAPTLESVARELRGRARVGKLNVDEHPEVASRYGVLSIPTLLVFRGGREVANLVGGVSKTAILQMLTPHLGVPAPASP